MSAGDVPRQDRIPADRLAEAGVWIARLHGDDRTPATEAGFREWLKAHPMNRRAFELSTDVWEDSLNLRRVVPFAHEVAKPRVRRFSYLSSRSSVLAAVAALVLAVVSGLYFLPRTVTTGIGEQRLLALEDGSRVFLNTATRISVRYSKQIRLVDLDSGEALFDVAKDASRPFVVQVGDRQIRALGTSFVVRRDKEQLAVTLVEGKVTVTQSTIAHISNSSQVASEPQATTAAARAHQGTAGSAEVFSLTPGQRLLIPERRPAHVDMLSVEKAVAWRRGQVILDDTLLMDAVTEMNRYNSRRLVIESSQAGHLLVNGLFQAGDSMSFANAVAQSFGLRVIERRNEIVLSGTARLVPSRNDDLRRQ